eukprot:PhF_6_TR7982/c0_g1_i1/m.12215
MRGWCCWPILCKPSSKRVMQSCPDTKSSLSSSQLPKYYCANITGRSSAHKRLSFPALCRKRLRRCVRITRNCWSRKRLSCSLSISWMSGSDSPTQPKTPLRKCAQQLLRRYPQMPSLTSDALCFQHYPM